jgi:hypothetical protein
METRELAADTALQNRRSDKKFSSGFYFPVKSALRLMM